MEVNRHSRLLRDRPHHLNLRKGHHHYHLLQRDHPRLIQTIRLYDILPGIQARAQAVIQIMKYRYREVVERFSGGPLL